MQKTRRSDAMVIFVTLSACAIIGLYPDYRTG